VSIDEAEAPSRRARNAQAAPRRACADRRRHCPARAYGETTHSPGRRWWSDARSRARRPCRTRRSGRCPMLDRRSRQGCSKAWSCRRRRDRAARNTRLPRR
jgi:hypothetical protein